MSLERERHRQRCVLGSKHWFGSSYTSVASMQKQACVWSLSQAAGPSQKAEGKQVEAESRQPRGPRQPWWTGVMDRRFVGSFEPLAAWLKAQVSAGGKFMAVLG